MKPTMILVVRIVGRQNAFMKLAKDVRSFLLERVTAETSVAIVGERSDVREWINQDDFHSYTRQIVIIRDSVNTVEEIHRKFENTENVLVETSINNFEDQKAKKALRDKNMDRIREFNNLERTVKQLFSISKPLDDKIDVTSPHSKERTFPESSDDVLGPMDIVDSSTSDGVRKSLENVLEEFQRYAPKGEAGGNRPEELPFEPEIYHEIENVLKSGIEVTKSHLLPVGVRRTIQYVMEVLKNLAKVLAAATAAVFGFAGLLKAINEAIAQLGVLLG